MDKASMIGLMAARGGRLRSGAGTSSASSGSVQATGAGPPSPPALRASRSRWRDPRLVLGVAVVALCAVAGARLFAAADDTVQVWAARTTLTEGQRVEAGDVVRRGVRFAEQSEADRYLSAQAPLPVGSTVTRPVGAGELLPRAALGRPDADALTEVPLSIASDAVPATVRVGSVVDVWVTPERAISEAPARTARSELVFDDVPVVAVPVTADSLGPAATRQVIVGVGSAQAAQLPESIAALGAGDLVLTVRQ